MQGYIATYRNREFSATTYKEDMIILRSEEINDMKETGFMEMQLTPEVKLELEELGMKPSTNRPKSRFKCMKYVKKEEIEEFYKVHETAEHMGYMADIIGKIDDNIVIIIDNLTKEQALELNMDEKYDRNSHVKTINKKDAIIHVERKLIFSNKSVIT